MRNIQLSIIIQRTAILFVARKYTNESNLYVSMDNSGNKNQSDYVTKVKVPNYNKVIYKVKCSEDNDGNNLYGENESYCNNFQHTKEEVTKDIEKQSFFGVNYKVVRFEPMEIRVLDKCPNCGLVGRPKIDRRPNKYDYHVRSGNSAPRFKTNRSDDFTLTYSHKIDGKVKKCTIGKLDKNHLNIIKDGKVHEKLKQHVFPFFIKSMKNA